MSIKINSNGYKLEAYVDKEDNTIDFCVRDKYNNPNPSFNIKVENGLLTIKVWEDFGDGKEIYSYDLECN